MNKRFTFQKFTQIARVRWGKMSTTQKSYLFSHTPAHQPIAAHPGSTLLRFFMVLDQVNIHVICCSDTNFKSVYLTEVFGEPLASILNIGDIVQNKIC